MIRQITIIFAFILGVSSWASAQSDYEVSNEGWLVNIEEAYKQSEKTGKPILANFTGSDWCGWCKKLSASVFNKEEFKQWADDNVVLLELDFPRRTQLPKEIQQQNYSLKNAFKVKGFPTIWVFYMDKNEKNQFNINALGKTGFRQTVNEFTSDVDKMISRAEG